MNPKFNELFYHFELHERTDADGRRLCSIKLFERATGGAIGAKISCRQFDAIKKVIKKTGKDEGN